MIEYSRIALIVAGRDTRADYEITLDARPFSATIVRLTAAKNAAALYVDAVGLGKRGFRHN